MIRRLLSEICFSPEFGRQMRFIAGPRQAGKTTLALEFLKQKRCQSFYYNWDDRGTRQRYREDPHFVWADIKTQSSLTQTHPWVCFDEIHKMPKWKTILKGVFDSLESKVQIIVTGSARLDYFRRSGDSLVGRYFLFHLYPLNLFELTSKTTQGLVPKKDPLQFIEERLHHAQYHQEKMEGLLKWGGFPEPLLKGSETFCRKWHADYLDRLVREDIRDLTQVRDLENVMSLIMLLPKRIGRPLSLNSLSQDLEVSHTAVRNYMKALELTYILFQISPYSRYIQRSLRKEKKVYFFNWMGISQESSRYENYVACELLAWVNGWNDAGLGGFELYYVRTRMGKETDFLILWDGKPWMLVEAKLGDQPIDSHHFHPCAGIRECSYHSTHSRSGDYP